MQSLAMLTCTAAVTSGLVIAVTPFASQGADGSRATTAGVVGAYNFPDRKQSPGATCKYTKGRLTAITLRAPSAAGRPFWEPGGQWILWSAQLESKTGRAGWKPTKRKPAYSGNTLGRSGRLSTLRPVSIRHVFGAPNTQYRVRETIFWYTQNTLVEGRAFNVVRNYTSRGARVGSCAGVISPTLPPLRKIRNEEQDGVKVSFADDDATGKVKYSLKRGTLPAGLRLKARTGVVAGRISENAVVATVDYQSIQSRTFRFVVAARANGQTTTRSYRWQVFDTAFVMPSYYGFYGCNGDPNCSEPVPNISKLGPKFSFGCTTEPQPGISDTSVIYKQEYQTPTGEFASSTGLAFRYGDIFRWHYYETTCA